jgi:hypothetical protein
MSTHLLMLQAAEEFNLTPEQWYELDQAVPPNGPLPELWCNVVDRYNELKEAAKMKDLDIKKCVKSTPAPDWFKQAMANGQIPIFGKQKSYVSKKPKAQKVVAE